MQNHVRGGVEVRGEACLLVDVEGHHSHSL